MVLVVRLHRHLLTDQVLPRHRDPLSVLAPLQDPENHWVLADLETQHHQGYQWHQDVLLVLELPSYLLHLLVLVDLETLVVLLVLGYLEVLAVLGLQVVLLALRRPVRR